MGIDWSGCLLLLQRKRVGSFGIWRKIIGFTTTRDEGSKCIICNTAQSKTGVTGSMEFGTVEKTFSAQCYIICQYENKVKCNTLRLLSVYGDCIFLDPCRFEVGLGVLSGREVEMKATITGGH